MGDFNEIANRNEKFGGRPPSSSKMAFFNNFLNTSNLIDLGFKGPKFTWTNCRDNNRLIRTHIDRFHANQNWLSMFPNTKILHLPRVKSDHCPLLPTSQPRERLGPRPFSLELFWFKHPSFFPSVDKYCNEESHDLDNKISSFTKNIFSWSKKTSKNIFHKKKNSS